MRTVVGGGRDTHDGHENSPILVFFSNLPVSLSLIRVHLHPRNKRLTRKEVGEVCRNLCAPGAREMESILPQVLLWAEQRIQVEVRHAKLFADRCECPLRFEHARTILRKAVGVVLGGDGENRNEKAESVFLSEFLHFPQQFCRLSPRFVTPSRIEVNPALKVEPVS